MISNHPSKQPMETDCLPSPRSHSQRTEFRFKPRPAWLQNLGGVQEVGLQASQWEQSLAHSRRRPGLARKRFNINVQHPQSDRPPQRLRLLSLAHRPHLPQEPLGSGLPKITSNPHSLCPHQMEQITEAEAIASS